MVPIFGSVGVVGGRVFLWLFGGLLRIHNSKFFGNQQTNLLIIVADQRLFWVCQGGSQISARHPELRKQKPAAHTLPLNVSVHFLTCWSEILIKWINRVFLEARNRWRRSNSSTSALTRRSRGEVVGRDPPVPLLAWWRCWTATAPPPSSNAPSAALLPPHWTPQQR